MCIYALAIKIVNMETSIHIVLSMHLVNLYLLICVCIFAPLHPELSLSIALHVTVITNLQIQIHVFQIIDYIQSEYQLEISKWFADFTEVSSYSTCNMQIRNQSNSETHD